MGYVLLFLALAAGAIKGFCGKKTSDFVATLHNSILANILRMLFCAVIGLLIIIVSADLSKIIISGTPLLISLLSGVATSIFVISWILSVKRSAYMMLDIFLMLGVTIPLLFSSFLFDDHIKPLQWCGLGILLISVFTMCSYNNSIKAKIDFSSFLLLLICGVSNGFADLSQKMFVKMCDGISVAVFNFYTYLIAFIFLGTFYFILPKKQTNNNSMKIKAVLPYIIVMAVCLFAFSFFKTEAAKYLNSAELYPLSQGLALIISTFMSAILFKEKITLKAVFGIVLAFISLIIINVIA